MSTAPLDPPTPRDDLIGIGDYTEFRFAEYDRAQAALGNLRVAYRVFGEALAKAEAAMDNVEVYNPEEWYEQGRRLKPADLRVPSRVVQFLTHDPEHFLEADVLVAALAREMFELHERVDNDRAAIARQLAAADKDGAA